jgi:hypothetical protein
MASSMIYLNLQERDTKRKRELKPFFIAREVQLNNFSSRKGISMELATKQDELKQLGRQQ